ncbi:mechanosensitive ion channel family protein [Dokdonia sinensis]|uniref:Mechanosensitive ion channel family protein n=1 Tax=Dokdonia sinensis TaxID=2479847 RepID=A0A3M0FUM5_9FLAO|nr:mechanosensitive ion channel domain-containing protein [Dokdonia sinensis]RMB56490.1 mechanosensitive ion channel family protein [Dokdonia sinensis]
MEKYQKYLENISEYVTLYGMRIVGAILTWIIGSWIIKKVSKFMRAKMIANKRIDDTMTGFLVSLITSALKIMLIIAILGNLGLDTTQFAAILAAAGLAIGLALQGSLSNFAGGVLILFFKPFKVGDLIEAQGEIGTVTNIQIFKTRITTPDNKEIIIPNGSLSNGNIANYTQLGRLRVDLTIGVSYDADIKQTKEVLLGAMTSQEKVLSDPAPFVGVGELADSSVNFEVRPWAKPEDYWDVYFQTIENCKLALDAAGIEIPYPHSVEIHKEG